MKKTLLLALGLSAACTLPPEVLPPPFGPSEAQDARLFFPTGLALVPADGSLLVANGNFNRAYDAGTVVRLPASFINGFFTTARKCDVAPPLPDGCEQPIPAGAPAVMIGNYAGPLILDATGTVAYTGSRDSGRLNAVALPSDGAVHCASGAGTDPDCRTGLVNLASTANLDGPYAIVHGDVILPGTVARVPVLFVASVVPHVEEISAGILYTSSSVGVLQESDPTRLLFTMFASNRFIANGYGVGPMIFDGARRALFLAGCYQRFAGTGAGEPSSGRCSGNTNNFLRVLPVDSESSAAVQVYDLYGDVLSTQTTQILLADEDATGTARTLWATMRSPDTLVRIDLPVQPSVPPRVQRAIPLPVSPADMVRIRRPGRGDLLAIVAEKLGSVAVYDVAAQQVVAQVERLGDSPFTLLQVPCPGGLNSACLATSVFGECRVGFIEVPLDEPWKAELRGRAGGCP